MTASILVTGAAGFVGYHTARRLLEDGHEVVGVDSLTPYYDVGLKEARLAALRPRNGFFFERLDLADEAARATCSSAIGRAASSISRPSPASAGH